MKIKTIFASLAALALSGMVEPAEAFPMPRSTAPDFKNVNAVVNGEFKKVNLSDFKGKYLVVVFYPFDFTYVCPTELISFSERLKEFKGINAEVIGVSTDSHFTHLAWIKTPRNEGGLGKIEYPLLADISKDISRDYGVLVTEKGDPMLGAALRGLFIIDPTQKIRSVQVNDDAVGRSVDETLRLIKAFQFADEHGEVCPANWKPGDKTIIPDQSKKINFFKDAYNGDKAAEKTENKKAYPEPEPKDTSSFWVQMLSEGTPGAHPPNGMVEMHYTGTLLDGKKFDSSRDRNQTFKFQLGAGQVIQCWEKGVKMLTKGQKAKFNCPPDLAYGARGAGGVIPPNATIQFDVELVNF